jgi:phospholipid/cholesterol/gamma-HCH transport system substrate-binding protein
MKPLQERNLAVVGAIGLGVCAGVVAAALQYDKLPFFSGGRGVLGLFHRGSGLQPGAEVQVAGHTVGQVSDVDLDGDRVLVSFEITEDLSSVSAARPLSRPTACSG